MSGNRFWVSGKGNKLLIMWIAFNLHQLCLNSDIQKVLALMALLRSCSWKVMPSFIESFHLIFGLPLFLLPFASPALLFFPIKSCLLTTCQGIISTLSFLTLESIQVWLFCSFTCCYCSFNLYLPGSKCAFGISCFPMHG